MAAKKSKSNKGKPATAKVRRWTPNSAWYLVGPDRPVLTRAAAEHYATCEKEMADLDRHMTKGPVKEAVDELVKLHTSAMAIAVRVESYIVEQNKRIEAQLSDPQTAHIRPVVPAGRTTMTRAEGEAHQATAAVLGAIVPTDALNLAGKVLSFADIALKNIERQFPRAVHQHLSPLGDGWSRAEWRTGALTRKDDLTRNQIRILNASQIPESDRPTAAEIVKILGSGISAKAAREVAQRVRDADERRPAPLGKVRFIRIRRAKYGKRSTD